MSTSVVSPYERFTSALREHGSRRRGRNWNCPAHDDRHPSLSVDESPTGMVLLKCHAGCEWRAILDALGLQPSDLFPNGQTALFPASRFSPVGLDVLRRLPPGAERSFIVASTLGRWVHISGGRETVYSQRQIKAVVMETNHRRAVRKELRISQPQLSNDIAKWKTWRVAHRCSTRLLTILVRESTTCPMCGSSLVDEQTALESSLVDERFVPKSLITDDGFSKEGSRAYDGTKALELMNEDNWSMGGKRRAAR
jgi:hypothetical protein